MKVLGFCGASGAGKTTLIVQLLQGLRSAGQRVSVVKHAHQGFDMDTPGKDSWRHREAGAQEVLVASSHRLALQRQFPEPVDWRPQDLLAELRECDWVLVEGFKHADLPKVEVWRAAVGQPPRFGEDPHIVAIATDHPAALPRHPGPLPVFALDQPAALVDHLLVHGARYHYDPASHA